MAHQESRYAKARKILLILFIVSSLLSLLLLLLFRPLILTPSGTPLPSAPDGASASAMTTSTLVVTIASCLTSAITFAGFVSITALMWRRDKRETAIAALEAQRAQLELDRMREMQEPGADLDILRRQLDQEQDDLLLIQERKAEYVMETAIPLELVKQERQTQERIEELERRLQELEGSAGKDEKRAQ